MAQPKLTDAQRQLWATLQPRLLDQAGAGDKLDSSGFARRMLQPGYVEQVRQVISPRKDNSDSAAFFEAYRTPMANAGTLGREDVPEPSLSSSREGTHDTLRYPAIGDEPARTRVEFRPSLNQRIKDGVDEAGGLFRSVLSGITRDNVRKVVGGVGPAGQVNTITKLLQRPDTLDAKTTNGTPRKR